MGRLVLTHQDRLPRFGSELVLSLCEHFGTEAIIVNASEDASFEEELVQDMREIMTVFSVRLHGSRSHKNQQVPSGPRRRTRWADPDRSGPRQAAAAQACGKV